MKKFDILIYVILVLGIETRFEKKVNAVPAEDENCNDEDSEYEDHVDENNENSADRKIERFKIIQSPRDSLSYRGLKLSNGLSVLLISDPDTDKAAACMTVAAGFMHDPEELPGLAHFLEHMLFMGSKKYPEENHFIKFIKEHAGDYNGSTGEECADYFWNIAHEHLEEALDIFAQFFISPLMDPSGADREVNAVDSEYSMNRTDDEFRVSQLQCSLSEPGHTHGHFYHGNLKSLSTDPKEKGIDVHKKLLELHSNRYSSNQMYLAVLGKESLDQLAEMVLPRFAAIRNKELSKSVHSKHPWGPEQLKRKVHYATVAETRILSLRFPMPEVMQYYKAAPLTYISALIGHEGPGSIFAELKRRNWCESLTVGADCIPGFSIYYIEITLTREAMNYIDDVIKLIFQYIHLLKNKKPQKWIFDEIRKIRETEFEYKPKSVPLDLVKNASASMVDYPMEDVISHELLIDQWDPDLIEYFLNYIRPDNMNILIGTKTIKEIEGQTRTEPWYGTKYNIETLSDDFIDKTWKIVEPCDKLHLPPRNEFIPNNFHIYPLGATESKMPRIIHETPITRFWFKQDDEFKLPRMNIHFHIYSPITCLNSANEGLTSIFVSLFVEKYTIYGYAAELAGLTWEVKTMRCGIEVELFGYHEKLPFLLQNLLSEMINFQPDKKKFKIKKAAEMRWVKNFATEQPYTQTSFYLSHLMYYPVHSKHEYLAALKRVQINDMNKLLKRLFSRIFVQGLIYGNCDEQLAMQVISIVENSLKSATAVLPQEVTFARRLEVDEGSSFTYTVAHEYSTSSSYSGDFQIASDYPLINVVLTGLFEEAVGEKCLHVLRTEEQLGYIAWCGIRRIGGTVSFGVLIQSEEHPAYLDSRFEVFLRDLRETLQDLTDDEVEMYKTSLKNVYMERIVDQVEKSEYYWEEISDRRYLFDKKEVMSELVNSLEREDILEFYDVSIEDNLFAKLDSALENN